MFKEEKSTFIGHWLSPLFATKDTEQGWGCRLAKADGILPLLIENQCLQIKRMKNARRFFRIIVAKHAGSFPNP